ncbi:hypothetical protein PQX77_015325 [Marasmius sp. AFHP31]|nr:hypothetical protein PQX77_015325 [Marasmius sp. AFHP31]
MAHSKRQMDSAAGFADNHYPSFYGSDFSNSPFIWTGGVNFTHAVASGDPFDTSVLLWTRAVPTSPSGTTSLPDQSVPACIAYQVFSNEELSGDPVTSGEAFTSYDVDWTVKVEAEELEPDTKYFYQFSDCANPSSVSPVGTTRTLASPDTPAEGVNGGNPLTLAVFSCSQYQAGYFNAYGVAAHNTSADVFVHLDIRDSGQWRKYWTPDLRTGAGDNQGLPPTPESISYRRESRIRPSARPMDYCLDDHEIANNGWKAGTSNSNDSAAGCTFSPSGACFTDRKLAAIRAYHEWMPIRQVAVDDQLRIWRNFQIGKLLDLTMLDTRFQDTLSESKARGAVWRVVGQQVVFSQLNRSNEFNLDQWDGYLANRMRILDHLYDNDISNTVILAGDSHANWVSDLAHPNDSTTYDPITGEGAIGVEFAGTAVTSGSSFGSQISPAAADVISAGLVDSDANLNLQWSEGSYRGFFTLTIDQQTLNATYYAIRNVSFPNLDAFISAEFVVEAGANKLARPVAGGVVNAGALKVNETS